MLTSYYWLEEHRLQSRHAHYSMTSIIQTSVCNLAIIIYVNLFGTSYELCILEVHRYGFLPMFR